MANKTNTNKNTQVNTKTLDDAVMSPLYPIEITYIDTDKTEKTIHAKSHLTLTESMAMVNSIVDTVIDDEYGYQPLLRGFALNENILIYYTDFKLLDSIEDNYTVINSTDIIAKVCKEIPVEQISKIEFSVDTLIEHKKKIIENTSEFDGLCKDVREFLHEFEEKFGKSFKPNDIKKLVKNMSNLKLNDKSTIDSIVNYLHKDDENKVGNITSIKEGK